MPTLERNIERRFRDGIKERGGWAIKFTGIAGIPDRLVILPGGQVWFVELKREGGRLSKVQKAVIRKLERLGCNVVVLVGDVEMKEWLNETTRLSGCNG